MSERGDQIQSLLACLGRHGELVAEAFDGPITVADRQRAAGIEALFAVGALKPYEQDSYRLNPRLREFLADHFTSYRAMQALRQVGGILQQARDQWAELMRLRRAGSTKDAERLFSALDESVADLGYSIENNLAMLHALLATQFGNVESLSSKFRQNAYYRKQILRFLDEVEGVDAFVELVSQEAIACGHLQAYQLVVRQLGSRLLGWTSKIKDAQSLISKQLFEMQVLQERVRRIARYSLWLQRNKTLDGWEVDVPVTADPALFRPTRLAFRPQPDVADTDPSVQEALRAIAQKLPPKPLPRPEVPDPGPQLLIEDDEGAVLQPVSPHQKALYELMDFIGHAEREVSLLTWKRGHPALQDLHDEAWLFFASMQLKGGGIRIEFVPTTELQPFALNEAFSDVHAHPKVAA